MNPESPSARAVRSRTYFLVSYATAGPMSDSPATATSDTPDGELDPVRGFFDDLSAAVAGLVDNADPASVGFYDQIIPVGTDRTKALAHAVGSTEVLVPLYSPRYLKHWPKPELEWFRIRLSQAGVADPRCHILPVLWTPLLRGTRRPSSELDHDLDLAHALGADLPEYLERGMRALLLTEQRQGPYRRIVDRLARQIVDCADGVDSLPRTIITVAEDQAIPDADVRFVVAVLAEEGVAWRPYPARPELNAAKYATDVAERLGQAPRAGVLESVKTLLHMRPSIVLIDPWILNAPGGTALIQSLATLPPWVFPVAVVDASDDRTGEEAVRKVDQVISLMGTRDDRPRVRVIRRIEEFVDGMTHLITRARARYLRLGQFILPDDPPPVPRMSLRFDPPTSTSGENR